VLFSQPPIFPVCALAAHEVFSEVIGRSFSRPSWAESRGFRLFSPCYGDENCGGAASERMRSLHDAKASSSAKRVGVRDFRALPDVVSHHAPLMPEFA